MRPYIVAALLFVFYALHQDFWNWNEARPLLFGFLPPGLWYHAGYTLAAAGVMQLAIRYLWPSKLEAWAETEEPKH